MLQFFPGATADDLPDGKGWAIENITLSTHSGTHMDAPWHYAPIMDGGAPAATIDQIPLQWCWENGVKFDFSDRESGTVITSEDFQVKLTEINYTLKPGDIVLVQSGADPYAGTDDYLVKGVGVGREGTLWLAAQGIHIVGTDAWSWDCPLPVQAERFAKNRDSRVIWEGHLAGRDCCYYQMEKLTNLDSLPAIGFQVICFPIKVERASAGWVRPVAVFSD